MLEQEKKRGFFKALRSPEYWLVVTACVVAAGGVSAWLVVPLAVGCRWFWF
jgi:hypothetical protein